MGLNYFDDLIDRYVKCKKNGYIGQVCGKYYNPEGDKVLLIVRTKDDRCKNISIEDADLCDENGTLYPFNDSVAFNLEELEKTFKKLQKLKFDVTDQTGTNALTDLKVLSSNLSKVVNKISRRESA